MTGTFNVSDIYMDMLRTLPSEDKIDLITKLVKSMKSIVNSKPKEEDIFSQFSSDWGGDMTTEEYAYMLRSKNIENTRTVENW